jgi:hypothetical protein
MVEALAAVIQHERTHAREITADPVPEEVMHGRA